MSSDVVLKVQNVSKCFEMYEKPVHRLYQTLCAGYKKFYKEFWALKDISFEVHKGECVGIVGRNGAGKSTLLQIITGTLQPTTGTVETHGRIAALLELGSGFNPEFTGRENVYMNAAILGLSREEIDARYQDILDFADIGDFINQPVKTYSSGMMVRLAFAVQIMIEPDILIVDEALSVGDAAFQYKCMTRLEEMRKKGMTLLFVSHSVGTVRDLCQMAIWLNHAQIEAIGDVADVTGRYMTYIFSAYEATSRQLIVAPPTCEDNGEEKLFPANYFTNETDLKRFGSQEITIERFYFGSSGMPSGIVAFGDNIKIILEAIVHKIPDNPICSVTFAIKNKNGIDMIALPLLKRHNIFESLHLNQRLQIQFSLKNILTPGDYVLVGAVEGWGSKGMTYYDYVENLMFFSVESNLPQCGIFEPEIKIKHC